MRELLDLGSAADVLKKIERGAIRVTTVESAKPSPFASALLFSYIANYIYEGDAPLAERRAQALAIDQSQLEEILGSTDFRELLDKAAIDELESQLQSLDPDYHAKHADGLHDLLLKLGDLTEEEIGARSCFAGCSGHDLRSRAEPPRRACSHRSEIRVSFRSNMRRVTATLWAPRCLRVWRKRFSRPFEEPLAAIVRRYARTHGPFTTHRSGERVTALSPARGRGRAAQTARRSETSRRRVPPRRSSPRMVRSGRSPANPAQVAGEACVGK